MKYLVLKGMNKHISTAANDKISGNLEEMFKEGDMVNTLNNFQPIIVGMIELERLCPPQCSYFQSASL